MPLFAEIEENVEVQLPNGAMSQQFKRFQKVNLFAGAWLLMLWSALLKNGDPVVRHAWIWRVASLSCSWALQEVANSAEMLTRLASQSDIFISCSRESLSALIEETRLLLKKLILLSLTVLTTHQRRQVHMPASQLQRQVAWTFSRYPGMDCIEIRVETDMGDVMRMEILTRIDGRHVFFWPSLKILLSKTWYAQIV